MTDWAGWLSVGKIANSASCSRSLNHLIELYAVDSKIELDKKNPHPYEEKKLTPPQITGKVAESILQYIMAGSSSIEKESRGKDICSWFQSIILEHFIYGNTKSLNLFKLEPPWVSKKEKWMDDADNWNSSDFQNMNKFCKNWVRESPHFGFNDLSWTDEFPIRVNLALKDGRFLPISGRMDLRTVGDENVTIIEIKETNERKDNIAYFQAETYAEMEKIKGTKKIKSYIYHNKSIKETDDRIRFLIDNANDDDFSPSFDTCSNCLNSMCTDAKRSN